MTHTIPSDRQTLILPTKKEYKHLNATVIIEPILIRMFYARRIYKHQDPQNNSIFQANLPHTTSIPRIVQMHESYAIGYSNKLDAWRIFDIIQSSIIAKPIEDVPLIRYFSNLNFFHESRSGKYLYDEPHSI